MSVFKVDELLLDERLQLRILDFEVASLVFEGLDFVEDRGEALAELSDQGFGLLAVVGAHWGATDLQCSKSNRRCEEE